MIIPHPQPHTPDPSPAEFSTNKSLKMKTKFGALHRHMEDLVLDLPDFRKFSFIISHLKTQEKNIIAFMREQIWPFKLSTSFKSKRPP
jgi:hypothetical protein